MHKLLLPLLLLSINCIAQNEIIKGISQQVSVPELKKNLYYLASEKLEGRMTASKGDTLASLYVADHFKKNGVQPAVDNGKNYFQAVPLNKKFASAATIIISNKTYQNLDGWFFSIATNNTTDLKNLSVVFVGYGIDDPKYNDLANIDVKGKAVILIQGQPRNADGTYLLSGNNRPANVAPAQRILAEKGAAAILLFTNRFTIDTGRLLRPPLSPGFVTSRTRNATATIPSITLSEQRVNELLAPAGITIKDLQDKMNSTLQPQSMAINNTISIKLNIETQKEIAPNVIGIIKGTDPDAPAIILSAHHDHEGIIGKTLYPGAVDNASGTTAIMEVARLMNEAAKKGQHPKKTIVFASYTGEEIGLVGSSYLAENPVVPLDKTYAVLNIDMMGRVDTFYSGRRADSMYAYILVKDTLNRGLRKALFDANAATGQELKLDPYYEQPQFMQRRLTGSDQYPFYLKGIPFLRIDCGFSKDYHRPTDTPDKINYDLLAKQVRLTFLTVWNLANDPL